MDQPSPSYGPILSRPVDTPAVLPVALNCHKAVSISHQRHSGSRLSSTLQGTLVPSHPCHQLSRCLPGQASQQGRQEVGRGWNRGGGVDAAGGVDLTEMVHAGSYPSLLQLPCLLALFRLARVIHHKPEVSSSKKTEFTAATGGLRRGLRVSRTLWKASCNPLVCHLAPWSPWCRDGCCAIAATPPACLRPRKHLQRLQCPSRTSKTTGIRGSQSAPPCPHWHSHVSKDG